jgi:hypothetical protein
LLHRKLLLLNLKEEEKQEYEEAEEELQLVAEPAELG